jgi:hypothetical protein
MLAVPIQPPVPPASSASTAMVTAQSWTLMAWRSIDCQLLV